MREPLEQISVQTTRQARRRIDKRVTDMKLQSRSRYVAAAIEMFEHQPDKDVIRWMKIVKAEMKRERNGT